MIKVQIKFSLGFSCVDLHKKKREFCVDLIQIIFLITIVYLYKRICQPDIKFYVYLCINIDGRDGSISLHTTLLVRSTMCVCMCVQRERLR